MEYMKIKTHKTNCIVCWKEIEVTFSVPIKEINCLEIECCCGPPKIKRSVLIVDDDIGILSTLSKMFEKIGFEVTTAHNETHALKEIKSEKIFDLVISDLFLGNDDGLQLLYKIRKQRPSIKTVLMSGSTLAEEELYLISVNDFLAKPFELSELKSAVQKVLEI